MSIIKFFLIFIIFIINGCVSNKNPSYIPKSNLTSNSQPNNIKKNSVSCTNNNTLFFSKETSVNEKNTVFGIPFGKNLNIKECNKSYDFQHNLEYSMGDKTICFQHAKQQETSCSPLAHESIRICYPNNSAPMMLLLGNNIDPKSIMVCMSAIIENNMLEGIRFNTSGIEFQSIAFDKLTEKYGTPTKTNNNIVQNKLGAKFDVLNANWVLDNLFVKLHSSSTRLDEGYIEISTTIGQNIYKKLFDEQFMDKTPL